MSFFGRLVGDHSARYLRSIEPTLKLVNEREKDFFDCEPARLREKSLSLRERHLRDGETLDNLLPEAFALVREAARQTLGQRHYDVQVLGGIALHQGRIAEMKTGEGKTLVATLAVFLNALSGRGVHVVTVNDYLARRDAVWMGQIYDALGLSVGVINMNGVSYRYDPTHRETDAVRDAAGSYRVFYEFLKPCSRTEAYAADITYGTNNEFGFDYLRDNIARRPSDVVQSSRGETGYNFAIIDEVDSVLIDEARTPLIISAPAAEANNLYKIFAGIAAKLQPESDYTVDEKFRQIVLTEEGIARAEKLLGLANLYTERGILYVHHLETAVRARALFQRDRDYVVKDGEVIIVDDFTGRLQPGRRWSEGLHQAVEAKEGVAIKQESRTYASITLQNYFKLYAKLAGMTGTALTSSEEFNKVYGLETVVLPTNQPSRRQDLNDLVFQTERGKWQALVRKVKEVNALGQPILIGTVSIEKNEAVSRNLRAAGVPHTILNAKNHEAEGEIIAGAGRRGSVVVATNMAGRGVDIKLGGARATKEDAEDVRALGGLLVIGTERHDARRIDNQLRGRAGRQGDPGVTQFYLSLEDDLARVFAGERAKKMIGHLGLPEDEPIEHRFVNRAIETAQKKIEGINFDRRRHVLDYDNVLNHQRRLVYDRRRKVLFGDLVTVRQEFERLVPAATGLDWSDLSLVERVRLLLLEIFDVFWMEHLESMEYLRSSVNLRAYGQRDPLVEYRREALRLFQSFDARMTEQLEKFLPNLLSPVKEPQAKSAVSIAALPANHDKVGRNDPCPCGSGKKYKKCHGALPS